jgi:hypothetical protein
VQKLYLVGFTSGLDGLILSVRKGSSSGGFVVDLDDALVAQVGDAERVRTGGMVVPAEVATRPSRASRHGSALNPRQLQDRLRAGWTVEEVAAEAGTDVEWVDRFAAPVRAEQARVVDQARAMTFDKPRLGPSSMALGSSVRRNLASRGLRPSEETGGRWSAFQVDEGLWVVRFAYTSRGRAQQAEWLVELAEEHLVARDRLASQLGHIGGGRTSATSPKSPPPKRQAASGKLTTRAATSTRAPAKRPVPAKKAAPAKRAPAKKAAPAKRAPAKKLAPAKKAPAKKSAPAKKPAPAKKAPAKKAPAKKAPTRPARAGAVPERSPAERATPAGRMAPVSRPAASPVRRAVATTSPPLSEVAPPLSPPAPVADRREAPARSRLEDIDTEPQVMASDDTSLEATVEDEGADPVVIADHVTAPEPGDTEVPQVVVLGPSESPSRRTTSGSDRIFRGQRPSTPPPPPPPPSPAPVVHGPLPPPAPIPVPERVREAVSEPIGSAHDTKPVPAVLDDADEPPFPNRGANRAPARRDEPLRASPVFRPDLIRSAGGRATAAVPPVAPSRNGDGGGGRQAPVPPPEPPDPKDSREDGPLAMDTLAALYPPPSDDSSAPEKIRRRRLRRS